VDWIRLVQDWDQWPVLLNMIMKLQDPLKAGNLLIFSATTAFSKTILCFMQSVSHIYLLILFIKLLCVILFPMW
jgi:hypothetical protein